MNSLLQAGSADSRGERVERAWRAVQSVEDPELPGLQITDLGIIRHVVVKDDGVLEVGLSPTYSGCPAAHVIQESVVHALHDAQLGQFAVRTLIAPPWSSDWISDQGRQKLLKLGIVPPERGAASHTLRLSRPVACPHCNSIDTQCVSQFGSTPCKALHRCRSCLEPFELFKCI